MEIKKKKQKEKFKIEIEKRESDTNQKANQLQSWYKLSELLIREKPKRITSFNERKKQKLYLSNGLMSMKIINKCRVFRSRRFH